MKRTLLDTKKGGKRYVRRKADGKFGEQDAVGKSLAADRRTKAKTKVKKGQGDRGDQKKPAAKRATTKSSARRRA